MGIVYYGNYAQYLEMGRVEWLRSLGISYRQMEESGILLPVVSLHIDFKKPAKYDDVLVVRTILKQKPSVKIVFDYEVYHEESDALLITANTILVFVNAKTGKPMTCPDFLLEKLNDVVF
ncbi:MAG: acyl-CoA thioesterase [Sinomicrobium sp.]|nr:acyl-CoA thioesterase [Sinomicrobium sp.]